MKKLLLPLLILTIISFPVMAQNLEVQKTEISPVIVVELGNPLVYELKITNLGNADTFDISSLAGFEIQPGQIELGTNETKTITIKAYPSSSRLKTTRGEFLFDYKIEGQTETFTDKLRVKMVELSDVFSIHINDINPNSTNAEATITNKEKIAFDNITSTVKSPFFDEEKSFFIGEYGKTNLTFILNEEQKNKLVAGDYQARFEIEVENAKATYESPFKYLEEEGLSSSESSSGFIVHETSIEKKNTGNTEITTSASKSLNILSRLFTTLSEKPTSTERQGFFVTYTWEKSLAPGESLEIRIKTNYTFPFILILAIIAVIVVVKFYLETNLRVKKHVSLVRTKGDEFAMRVRINVKAKKNIQNIQLTDRVPQVTKLYDKFGIKPDKIDSKSRTLTWNIKNLNSGEERTFSYIIYSKIKVMGRFDLPSAVASYEKDGKKLQSYSNKTSLATETTERPIMAEDFI